jgi:WD40 repeat protein
MRALVEPSVRGEPLTTLTGHTAAVQALAISPDGRLLASAGDDRQVLLWRWPEGLLHQRLAHPGEVRAVAFGPAQAGHYPLLTGCSDSQLRLWKATPQGYVNGPVVLPRVHDGAILALAISPDGRWFASAGEDRRIALWDFATGKFLYWVRATEEDTGTAHQGAVTTVQFLPDGHLLSAARDNTLKRWKLGAGAAQLAGKQAGRTGDVLHLGTTPDGKHVLFDHGDELWVLRTDDWALAGKIQSRQHGHFQHMALFAPGGKLLLTVSTNGRAQLWKAPASPEAATLLRHGYGHGFHAGTLGVLGAAPAAHFPGSLGLASSSLFQATSGGATGACTLLPRLWNLDAVEIRHFLTPNAAILCAAFAPNEQVVLTAGSDKVIRAWPIPPSAQWSLPLEAQLTFVASQVERGTDMVRLRAEVDNPADPGRRLLPGMFATLRFYPEAAAIK